MPRQRSEGNPLAVPTAGISIKEASFRPEPIQEFVLSTKPTYAPSTLMRGLQRLAAQGDAQFDDVAGELRGDFGAALRRDLNPARARGFRPVAKDHAALGRDIAEVVQGDVADVVGDVMTVVVHLHALDVFLDVNRVGKRAQRQHRQQHTTDSFHGAVSIQGPPA